MDWFERLMGFRETGYAQTRSRLVVDGETLRSSATGQAYGIGRFELMSLAGLRSLTQSAGQVPGRRRVRIVEGDVGALHRRPAYAGAMFQVASQFNMLEMIGPELTPEHGVTRYAHDSTQGPACAIAAGAATVYRNYFVPCNGQTGQTREHQLDGFAHLGALLAQAIGQPAEKLWTMHNGYTLFTTTGVDSLGQYLRSAPQAAKDTLRAALQIGVHWDVEVTVAHTRPGPLVSQAFCSAIPVSYNAGAALRSADWEPLATLVLEAAYEATLLCAVANAQRGTSKVVLLTQLGGGAFGNAEPWILAAMRRALAMLDGHGLDVVIVSYGRPSAALQRVVEDCT
jgi:hypothetical protein